MYIEELIVDGFKSYATRTTIGKWDPEFNAITGLNGSGKSNILDAICFLLGITTLSHVRANNLQDLVYKRGQAGINKASVTIIFNNRDKTKSPPGYHDSDKITITRQIVVNGRNKYMVNGVSKSQQDVATFFQSVQLNVNNPHFLIMQGKVTKVLNMKPQEILAMVEEAAGTRMFGDRKERAEKTMTKKDAKLEEINSILESEVKPKLEKLRVAKRKFFEYQRIDNEISRFTKMIVAHDYKSSKIILSKIQDQLEEKQQTIKSLESFRETIEQELNNINIRLEELEILRSKNNEKYQELESKFRLISNELTKCNTQCQLKQETLKEEEENLKAKEIEILETINQLDILEKKKESISLNAESKTDEFKSLQKEIQDTEDLIQSLTTGITKDSDNSSGGGYHGKIQEIKNEINILNSNFETAKVRSQYLQSQIDESLPKAKKAEQTNSSLIVQLKSSEQVIESLEREISLLEAETSDNTEIKDQVSILQKEVKSLRQKSEQLERQLYMFKFDYCDPTPNFDRSQVKGLVAELVNLDESSYEASTALEICAGGRLYNVVVSTEKIGSQLLERGKLKKRVTLIPLNKIQAFKTQVERITTAKSLAPGKVDLALNLIGYDEELSNAMSYVFGSTLICKDKESANKVTFNNNVRMRSITFDGDTYDPSGTLSGGSNNNSGNYLLKFAELRKIKKELVMKSTMLSSLEAELEDSLMSYSHYEGLKEKCELKKHEYELLKKRIDSNPATQIIQKMENWKKEIEEIEIKKQNYIKENNGLKEKLKHFENELKEFNSGRETKLNDIKKDLKSKKMILNKKRPQVDLIQKEILSLKEEILQTKESNIIIEESIKNSKESINIAKNELDKTLIELEDIKINYNNINEELIKERKIFSLQNKEMSELESIKKNKKNQLQESEVKVRSLTQNIDELIVERTHCNKKVQLLLGEHSWIPDMENQFGINGTEFDYTRYDIKEMRNRLEKLHSESKSLERSLDRNVIEKYDKIEKKDEELRNMLNTIIKDKKKIQDTIFELDKFKVEALTKTWEKVNVDFGAIFGDLLPGNTCELQPLPDKDITEGLEVKVRLGKVWKDSLSELSGGQRSLIALSLILSLLQFKSAPMYILDEVDAALDLNHTQNIGQLLRNRFKGSQFIVVSLKDGMFNNANVLFRTKFREGVSTVERHTAIV